ncbi:MAG: hypothetical protein AB1515_07890 [Nitrospirota bacterium]
MSAPPQATPGMTEARDPSSQLAAAVLVHAFYTACTLRQQMGDNLTLERRQAIFEEVWRTWREAAHALAAGKSGSAPQLYTPTEPTLAGQEIA